MKALFFTFIGMVIFAGVCAQKIKLKILKQTDSSYGKVNQAIEFWMLDSSVDPKLLNFVATIGMLFM